MKTIVVWSGGMDSTLMLAQTLLKHEMAGQVKALTLIHPQLPQAQLKKERQARSEFKRWAKERHGWTFEHFEVKVTTKGWISNNTGQAAIWLSFLNPYFDDHSEVCFGHIRGDDLWHFVADFRQAFDAMMRLHDATPKLMFPYEWCTKVDIVRGLKAFCIPRRCWWTCEEVVEGKKPRACGKCRKCREYKRAREDAKDDGVRGYVRIHPHTTIREQSSDVSMKTALDKITEEFEKEEEE